MALPAQKQVPGPAAAPGRLVLGREASWWGLDPGRERCLPEGQPQKEVGIGKLASPQLACPAAPTRVLKTAHPKAQERWPMWGN